MVEVKKCKISYKNKNGKLIMSQRGFCDKNNPGKRVDLDTEIDIGSAMSSMNSVMDKFDV